MPVIQNQKFKDFPFYFSGLDCGLPMNGSCHIHSGSKDNLHQRFSNYLSSFNQQEKDIEETPLFQPDDDDEEDEAKLSDCCPEVSKALSGVLLIAEQKKRMEESTKVGFV